MARLVIEALLAVCCTLALAGCLTPKRFDEDAWRARVEATREADLAAPHREPSGRFFNPWLPMEERTGDFWRWTLSRNSFGNDREGKSGSRAVPNDGAYLRDPAQRASVTEVGHATFVIQ